MTHRCRRSLGVEAKNCINRAHQLHPGWDLSFFTDGDCQHFVQQKFPELLELYLWYPRAVMRADLFRLLAVYELGGFYLDCDVLLSRPLDQFTELDCVFPVEQRLDHASFSLRYPGVDWTAHEGRTIGNYAFGASPAHPFLAEIIEVMVGRSEFIDPDYCNDRDVLYATGPEATSAAYFSVCPRSDLTVLDGPGQTFGDFGVHLLHSCWRSDLP